MRKRSLGICYRHMNGRSKPDMGQPRPEVWKQWQTVSRFARTSAALHKSVYRLRRALDEISTSRPIRRLRRYTTPIGEGDLRNALDTLIPQPQQIVLVHSSLGSCGHFRSGPDRVLDAISEQARTLFLVTHSYCYPKTQDTAGSIFNPVVTPSQNGTLTNMFRVRPDVRRSIHATHSLAGLGPDTDEIVAGHYLNDSPCGVGTPYARLIRRRASVLMFGVSFYSYTLFHTAEFEAGSEFAWQHGVLDRLRVIDEAGAERVCLSRRQNWAPNRFAEVGDLLEFRGLARRVQLGRNALRFVPDAAKVHEFLLERLRVWPDFLRASCRAPLQ